MYAKKLWIYQATLSVLISTAGKQCRCMGDLDTSPFRVFSVHVTPSTVIRELGIYLDSDDSMQSQVSQTGSHCFYILRQLHSSRNSVSCTVFQSLVVATLANNFEGIRLLLWIRNYTSGLLIL